MATKGAEMEFTIERSKWLRGEGGGYSYLLRASDNKMCCLGFRALKCGLSCHDIRHQRGPVGLLGLQVFATICRELAKAWVGIVEVDKFGFGYTAKGTAILQTNDAPELPEPEREEKLTKLFTEIGDTVTFVD